MRASGRLRPTKNSVPMEDVSCCSGAPIEIVVSTNGVDDEFGRAVREFELVHDVDGKAGVFLAALDDQRPYDRDPINGSRLEPQ